MSKKNGQGVAMRGEYAMTDVGMLPTRWHTATAGELFEIELGKMLDAEKNRGVSKPYLGNRAVQWGRIDVESLPTMRFQSDELTRYQLQPGDLLVCEGGEVGRAAIWTAPIAECYYQKALHRLRPKSTYSTEFMFHVLQWYAKEDKFTRLIGQTSIAHLPKEKFAKLPVPLPPLPEQRAIATALSDTDDLIESLERLIAKKRRIKEGAMGELLSGERRLEGFEGEWVEKELGEIAEIVMGQSPSSQYYNREGNGLPLIQGNADIRNRESIRRIFTTDSPKRASSGDILITVRAPVGEIARAVFDCCVGRGVAAIKGGSDFLYHLLIWLEPKWEALSKGSTFDSINSSDLRVFLINLPPLAEQHAIATLLTDMDREIEALEEKLAKVRRVKEGMMGELLGGRVRLV